MGRAAMLAGLFGAIGLAAGTVRAQTTQRDVPVAPHAYESTQAPHPGWLSVAQIREGLSVKGYQNPQHVKVVGKMYQLDAVHDGTVRHLHVDPVDGSIVKDMPATGQ